MAATEDSADNSLWDASVCRKSWADMVEEEEAEEKCSSKGRKPHVEENSKDDHPLRKSRDWRNSKSLGFRSSARLSKNMATTSILEEPIHDEEANLGNVDEETKIPKVESLPTFGRNLGKNQPRTPVKQQPQLPQEDISLTGHLDVKLGLVSPAKMGTDRLTSVRSSVPRASPSKGSKRKAENGLSTDDQMLMPSPSKILRSTPKKEELLVKKEETATAMASPAALLTRKRVRDLLTPTSSSKSAKRREKRDPETDPDVLARRQKQIDFGKNTLGYEHYRQMVPKPEREKNHPKTPPIGIKFSRRAWDGLVRVWRQRLHFWDPPEDGGGNPACLEIQSDASDCYSTDGSLPNTPVQEVKRKRAERSMRFSSRRSEVSEPDEDDGCTPLPD